MLTQVHVAILRYWQDESISVILKMHNHRLLTHWGRDKMAAILQTTCAIIQSYFSTELIRADATGCSFPIEQRQNDRHLADDIFKFTSMYDFFHFNQKSFKICPQRSISGYVRINLDNGLAMIRRQTIIWTYKWQLFISFHEQWSPVYRVTSGWRYQFWLKYPKLWSIGAAFTATAVIAHMVFTLNYLKSTISG